MRSKHPSGLTPNERKIMAILSDGMFHSTEELCRAVDNTIEYSNVLRVHICDIRKKIKNKNLNIIAEGVQGPKPGYRQVRYTTTVDDE